MNKNKLKYEVKLTVKSVDGDNIYCQHRRTTTITEDMIKQLKGYHAVSAIDEAFNMLLGEIQEEHQMEQENIITK